MIEFERNCIQVYIVLCKEYKMPLNKVFAISQYISLRTIAFEYN